MIDVIIKVGDKPGQSSLKDGMVVCYTQAQNHSAQMRKAFAIIRVPDSMKSALDALVGATVEDVMDHGEVVGRNVIKCRAKKLDLSTLAVDMQGAYEAVGGRAPLENAWRGSGTVPELHDAKIDINTHVKDVEDMGAEPKLLDKNAVAHGTYYVGTGGDYTTWAAAAADCGTQDGDLTFIQITATAETAWILFDHNTQAHNLTLQSALPHRGDPTGGYLVESTFDQYVMSIDVTGTGQVEIKDLYIKRNAASGNYYYVLGTNGTGANTLLWHDLLIDGHNDDGDGVVILGGSRNCYAYNIVVWDVSDSSFKCGAVALGVVENCTVYNGYDRNINLAYAANWTFRNCLSMEGTSSDFTAHGSSDGYNNASSDATAGDGSWSTGANNQINVVTANQVESTDDTVADFMQVKEGGVSADGGATPTIAGNTQGIRGEVRPQTNGDVSIGADELPSPGGGGGAGSGGGLSGAITAAMVMGYYRKLR